MGCAQSLRPATDISSAAAQLGGPPLAQKQSSPPSDAAHHLLATAKLLAGATANMTAQLGVDKSTHARESQLVDAATRQELVSNLRAALMSAQDTVDKLEEALPSLTAARTSSTRSGHLKTLAEQIGVRPQRKWQDEWQILTDETLELQPWLAANAPTERDLAAKQAAIEADIGALEADGWPRHRASTYCLLHARKAAIARALRDGSRVYAAATYALCDAIFLQHAEGGIDVDSDASPAMLYTHIDGLAGLALNEPAWCALEEPDRTGFRGLTSSSLVSADCDPGRFAEAGHCAYDFSTGTLVPVDSDVVGFLPLEDSADGAHSAVSTGATYGCFPPNTLFRLREVKEAGTWAAPGGVWPRQRLLVVSATYRPVEPLEVARLWSGGKMCSALSYGTRQAFVDGVDDLSEYQTLSLADEWQRPHAWSDWKGECYSMRDEWAYVNGVAATTPGRTAGTRDAHNDGKTLDDFLSAANGFIRMRRASGHGTFLNEDDALLTRDEVIAVRLYTGPGYQVVNEFLRQIAGLSGGFRRELIQHPGVTLAATVVHLMAAVRKLSAVATAEEAQQPLWRGVRGTLPRGFWLPDAAGMVCAVDMAFMSTSRHKQTPVEYMGGGDNVLWALKPGRETDSGFHCGADVSLLSQFAQEQEVLFPPATMLEVVDADGVPLLANRMPQSPGSPDFGGAAGDGWGSIASLLKADGKRYQEINVRPTFV